MCIAYRSTPRVYRSVPPRLPRVGEKALICRRPLREPQLRRGFRGDLSGRGRPSRQR
jgi:hypothetical protein